MLKSHLWMLALGMAFSDSLPPTDSFAQTLQTSTSSKGICEQDLDGEDDENIDDDKKNGMAFSLIEILEIQKDRLEKNS